jgi:hypothetical protein
MATTFPTLESQAVDNSRLPGVCFKIASFTAVIGVSLGIYMGIAEDHLLAPVHVHINLVGWVSLFLFGQFYKLHPKAIGNAAVAQVFMGVAGYIIMMTGLAGLLLSGSSGFFPMAVIGSLLVFASFLLFLILVVRNA